MNRVIKQKESVQNDAVVDPMYSALKEAWEDNEKSIASLSDKAKQRCRADFLRAMAEVNHTWFSSPADALFYVAFGPDFYEEYV